METASRRIKEAQVRIRKPFCSILAVAGALGAQTPVVAPPSQPVGQTPSQGSAAPAAPSPVATPASTVPPVVSTTTPPPAGSTDTKGSKTPDASTVLAEGPKSANPPAGGADEGFQFHPGLSFGTLTVDGKTWTRLSFMPEIGFGKLGVGFNLEMFLDETQDLSTKGWDFDSREQTLESVLRKVDYVRWAQPGDPFYLRLGTLHGIDLGHGLVASGYGNMARYPDYKLLGLHTQLNDMTGIGLDLELVVNNLQDLDNGGPFTALRAGFRPLKPTGMPLLGGLAIGVGGAYDWNQYAGLRDKDGDGCPDEIDAAPNDKSTCAAASIQPGLPFVTQSVYASADSMRKAQSDSLRRNYSESKPFAMYWLQADMPVVTMDAFGLSVYSVFAKPQTQDPATVDAGWGLIPVGASSHFGPFSLSAEYRVFNDPFQPGYFNAMYDNERARIVGKIAETKEILIYGKENAQEGWLQGYFAGAQCDVYQFVTLGADYSHMFPSRSSQEELRAAGAKIALGKAGATLLKKISTAEVYWRKDRIGLDKRMVIEGGIPRVESDGFFDKSVFTVYGVRVGSQIAPGLELIVDRQTSFHSGLEGNLEKENQMRVETRFVF